MMRVGMMNMWDGLGKVWDNVVKHGTMWQSMTNQHVVPFTMGGLVPNPWSHHRI